MKLCETVRLMQHMWVYYYFCAKCVGNQKNTAINATHVENNTNNDQTHTKINIMAKHVEPGSKDGQDPGTDVKLRVICLV